MTNPLPQVTIYTDGGCQPNPGVGAWAALLLYDEHEKELSGGHPDTTNNQMELTAAIEALAALKQTCAVTLYTDSTYLRNGITKWLPGWIKNGWMTTDKKPVKNQALWTRLYELTQQHTITWKWVKGHASSVHNNRVDQLATEARERLRQDNS